MKLEFKGKKYKTKVQTQPKGGPPVHWNTEFWLPAQLPVLAPKVELKLMDHDDIGSDELAGTLQLKTKDIIEDKFNNNGEFIWHNIYGCPLNQSGSKAKEIMNNDPDFASEWKGRVLLQIIGEATEKPMAKQ
jgi:Ca2+-dependent lipid-binding protein|tara:strand:- start:150 stop:545 length:396 start_codon:yes stop_codon:yes gene_type:complete